MKEINDQDLSSIALFALYQMQQIPEYSTLSELAYILDSDSLLKFLRYFGGTSVKVPTIEEYIRTLKAIALYNSIDVNHVPYDKAVKTINVDDSELKEIKKIYRRVIEILQEYHIENFLDGE